MDQGWFTDEYLVTIATKIVDLHAVGQWPPRTFEHNDLAVSLIRMPRSALRRFEEIVQQIHDAVSCRRCAAEQLYAAAHERTRMRPFVQFLETLDF